MVSDVDRKRVVEVLDARSRRRVERYLRALPEQRRRAIEVVSIDLYEGPTARRSEISCPGRGSSSTTSTWCGVGLWSAELLAYFDEQTTNGYAEGVINKVKVIKRCAYGPPRFAGFRARVRSTGCMSSGR